MKRLSSRGWIVTATFLLLTGSICAEEASPPGERATLPAPPAELLTPRGAPVRIGVVDLDRVERDSLLGQEYGKRFAALDGDARAEGARRQQALAKIADELVAETERLRKAQTTEDLQERQQRLTRLIRERDTAQQDAEMEMGQIERKLQREHERLRQELRGRLVPFVEAVIKQRSLDVIFDHRACIAVNREIDVTDDVIRAADQAQGPAARPADPGAPIAEQP